MTEITLFDYFGNELGKDVQHLTLAFAYGDGREQSCELMAEAVSDLLFGLKIDGYFAVNLRTIAVFNDEIGGVEVVIKDRGLAVRDPAFQQGEGIVLKGEQAEHIEQYAITNMAKDQYMDMGLAILNSPQVFEERDPHGFRKRAGDRALRRILSG